MKIKLRDCPMCKVSHEYRDEVVRLWNGEPQPDDNDEGGAH
jgi:hypothetical protein